jgi:hypothetical protein
MNLDELKKLAGITSSTNSSMGQELSKHATNLHKREKELNLKPGDPDWFKLWFAKPYLTQERPPSFRGRKK